MDIKLKTHLMLLLTFMLCNFASIVMATGSTIVTEKDVSMTQESDESIPLYTEDDIVEKNPSNIAIREIGKLRGKRFEWLGNADSSVAEEKLHSVIGVTIEFL